MMMMMMMFFAATSATLKDMETSTNYPVPSPRGIKGSTHFAAEPTAVRTGPRQVPLSSGLYDRSGRGNHVTHFEKRKRQSATRPNLLV